jgi:hypothetical protein
LRDATWKPPKTKIRACKLPKPARDGANQDDFGNVDAATPRSMNTSAKAEYAKQKFIHAGGSGAGAGALAAFSSFSFNCPRKPVALPQNSEPNPKRQILL